MANMAFIPLDDSTLVTKSSAMQEQGRDGMERGCNNPAGVWLLFFPLAQTKQAEMYSLTSNI